MANFYPEQYKETGTYPINHNYLPQQFADMDKIWQKVRQVVVDGDFTLGNAVDQFERDFAKLNDGRFGIGVGSGTDALFLSLKVLGIREGDEVITTPFTFFATAGAIVTAGATPVFVDAGEDFNIDASKIEQAITTKTKAIVPVHWSGNPCDMTRINAIAKEHHIAVVADACHAIESTLYDKGIAQFSDLTCFSLHPLKNLNVWGDGGMIVTNNADLAEKLYLIRNHGLKNRDECLEFSYNSRLDTIQAVIAQHLFDNHLQTITQSRIKNALYLDTALADVAQIQIPVRSSHKKAVYHLYQGLFERRDELQIYLQDRGIDAKVHYPIPMHLQPAASKWKYSKGDFPIAEYISENCLSLPVHEFIAREQLDHMIESIKQFYRGA
jgi:dTDP-4-amino-4,6-dideoxygalactose transaminase